MFKFENLFYLKTKNENDKIYKEMNLLGLKLRITNYKKMFNSTKTQLTKKINKLDSRVEFLTKLLDLKSGQLEFFRQHCDITSLKPADGELRELQLNTLEFAKEITDDINANNMEYFLLHGSLLGAIRHKGFIPWDDDFDFGMLREDYEKYKQYCREKYIEADIDSICGDETQKLKELYILVDNLLKKHPDTVLFIDRGHFIQLIKGKGLYDHMNMDIFPFDYYKDDLNFEEHKEYLKELKEKINNIESTKNIKETIEKERLGNSNITKSSNHIYYGLLVPQKHTQHLFEVSQIFPLKKVTFEKYEFNAPNNPEYYLKNEIGEDYMEYPEIVGNPHHIQNRKLIMSK